MRKKHLGVFRKKKTEEFSVAYLNNTETGGLMDPPYDTGNLFSFDKTYVIIPNILIIAN